MLYIVGYIKGDISGYYDESYNVEEHFTNSTDAMNWLKSKSMNFLLSITIEDFRSTELKLTSEYDSAFDSIIIFNDKVTKILVYNELLESSISEYKSHLRDEKLKQIGI
jgi:hypothetical protein